MSDSGSASAPSTAWTVTRIERLLAHATVDDQGTVRRYFEGLPEGVRESVLLPPSVIDRLELTEPQKALLFERRLRIEHPEAVRAAEQKCNAIADVFRTAARIASPAWLAVKPEAGEGPRELNANERALVEAYMAPYAEQYTKPTLAAAHALSTGLLVFTWTYSVSGWSSHQVNAVSILDHTGRELTTWRPKAESGNNPWTKISVLPDSSFVVTTYNKIEFFEATGERLWVDYVNEHLVNFRRLQPSGIVELSYHDRDGFQRRYKMPDGTDFAGLPGWSEK
jgi:hypothetical protein